MVAQNATSTSSSPAITGSTNTTSTASARKIGDSGFQEKEGITFNGGAFNYSRKLDVNSGNTFLGAGGVPFSTTLRGSDKDREWVPQFEVESRRLFGDRDDLTWDVGLSGHWGSYGFNTTGSPTAGATENHDVDLDTIGLNPFLGVSYYPKKLQSKRDLTRFSLRAGPTVSYNQLDWRRTTTTAGGTASGRDSDNSWGVGGLVEGRVGWEHHFGDSEDDPVFGIFGGVGYSDWGDAKSDYGKVKSGDVHWGVGASLSIPTENFWGNLRKVFTGGK